VAILAAMFVLDDHVGRSTKDADEELACLVLGAVLDTRVKRVDKSPLQGHHDLEIYYSDDRLGAGEVVSTRDPIWMKLVDAFSGRGYTKCAELTRLWFVVVKPKTSLKKMQSHVPSLLDRLESQRIDKVSSSGHGDIQDMLKRLGIDFCSSSQPTAKHPPGFYLMPNARAAWVGNGENVRQFCEDFLADKPGRSKVDKLRRAKADERHLVIILTMDQVGPHTAVDTGELPVNPPDLPQGIDWLWVIASKSTPIRTIYWNPVTQWSEVVFP
jgi:hypothetical protein